MPVRQLDVSPLAPRHEPIELEHLHIVAVAESSGEHGEAISAADDVEVDHCSVLASCLGEEPALQQQREHQIRHRIVLSKGTIAQHSTA